MSSETKKCSGCSVIKPRDAFCRDRSKPDGACSRCRDCQRLYSRARFSVPENLEARREKSRAFRRDHPEKFKRSVRSATLKKKYGISIDDFEKLLEAQGRICAICGSDHPGTTWGLNLHVDHEHTTGRIRGLLCQACNTSLGKMQESPELLRKAALYIERGGVLSKS